MTQGDDKWDAMTDEEFIADYVAKHGLVAARAIAKTMSLPAPKPGIKPYQREFVGVRPVKLPALTAKLRKGTDWKERESRGGFSPTLWIVDVHGAMAKRRCEKCGLILGAGNECVIITGGHPVHRFRTQSYHSDCFPGRSAMEEA